MPASVGTVVTPARAARLLDELDPATEEALDAALGGRGRGRAALQRRRDGASPKERRQRAALERRAFSAEADPAALEELARLRAQLRDREEALDAAVAGLRRDRTGGDETGRHESGRGEPGRDAAPGWGERSETTGGDDADCRTSAPPRPRRRLGVIAALVAVLGLAALGTAASVALAPRPSLEVFTELWAVPDDVATRPLSTLASLRVFHWGPTRYLGSIAGVDYFATLSLDSFSAAELADESVCLYGLARSDGDVVVTDCAATGDFIASGMTLSPDDYQGDAGGTGVAWGPTGGIRSSG
ncbi:MULTISPECIES: hypothetical protein [unclassified Rathayibacter]|uniref:hypothetical protein n=1 Tax=unclassified Rathayibacter TaxID=2609250 RepID=UPI000CE8173B|nr:MULTISPECIES: hypothetical protein [unclassified Rathayibacter]PPI40912.1 hypothetical protein C5D50_05130 [Rathayibacter sp. RFBD1]PPI60364.1 hypothetical protein C5D38_04860 [Rathayibacter sp. TRS19]